MGSVTRFPKQLPLTPEIVRSVPPNPYLTDEEREEFTDEYEWWDVIDLNRAAWTMDQLRRVAGSNAVMRPWIKPMVPMPTVSPYIPEPRFANISFPPVVWRLVGALFAIVVVAALIH